MGRGDHIIIPKSILKRFCGKNNKVSVFYLNTRILDQKFPDEIFTELNYYFNDNDKFIQDKCETIIGNLYATINRNLNMVKISDIESMKNIFVIQHFRNNSFISNLYRICFINRRITHNLILSSCINYLKSNRINSELEEIYSYIDKLYNKLTPGFLKLENTKRKLILPSSQFSFLKFKGYNTYLYPIAPNVALTWRELSQKKDFEYATISCDNTIGRINNLMIDSELKNNTDNIIFGLDDEINRLYYNKDI